MQLLGENEVQVHQVTLAQPTLDDVFLRKTGHHMVEHSEEANEEGGSS